MHPRFDSKAGEHEETQLEAHLRQADWSCFEQGFDLYQVFEDGGGDWGIYLDHCESLDRFVP